MGPNGECTQGEKTANTYREPIGSIKIGLAKGHFFKVRGHITVTGDEAAQQVAVYIKDLSHDNRFEVSHVVCDDLGVCSDGQRGDNPTATLYWRLLALSKVDPNSKEFSETFELIKKDPEPNYQIGLWITYRALTEA